MTYNAFFNLPKFVYISDVTTRDGCQNEEKYIHPDAKIYVLDKLADAGFQRIEVTNYGNPKRTPQLRDAHELMQRVPRLPHIR